MGVYILLGTFVGFAIFAVAVDVLSDRRRKRAGGPPKY